jgi:hypothetical protein
MSILSMSDHAASVDANAADANEADADEAHANDDEAHADADTDYALPHTHNLSWHASSPVCGSRQHLQSQMMHIVECSFLRLSLSLSLSLSISLSLSLSLSLSARHHAASASFAIYS